MIQSATESKSQSRRAFLRRSAAVGVASGAAALLLPGNSAFALPSGPRGERDDFKAIRRHENNHVEFLVGALGSAARPKPTFQGLSQDKFAAFRDVAQVLENTGVRAYLGAAPAINNPDYLAAAASIALIEASHAGYLNVLMDDPITGDWEDSDKDNDFGTSFYFPMTPADVAAAVAPFIVDLNGGPDVNYSTMPSSANDIDILNFALALEYLEAEFYNINVKRFYGH